jgi:hypothetical protein
MFIFVWSDAIAVTVLPSLGLGVTGGPATIIAELLILLLLAWLGRGLRAVAVLGATMALFATLMYPVPIFLLVMSLGRDPYWSLDAGPPIVIYAIWIALITSGAALATVTRRPPPRLASDAPQTPALG